VSTHLRAYETCPPWTRIDEQSLWRELVACILGSQVPFELAQAAVSRLSARGLLNVEDCLRDGEQFQLRIVEALLDPIHIPEMRSGNCRRYRYPHLRGSHIRRTAESIYQVGESIGNLLNVSTDSYDARMRIMSATIGVGPKQSSLFLRNIGYADDLAILDTHVLRYVSLLQLLPTAITARNLGLTTYEKIERALRAYGKTKGLSLSRLDTAIWVVMRVFRREFA
jgi:N-glycosylase/DNA lyase